MQNDEQSIRQLVSTWLSATESGDNELVLSLMSEDVVFSCLISHPCARPTLPRVKLDSRIFSFR